MDLFNQGKKLIEDLKAGDRLDGFCKVIGLEKRNKKDGDPFLMLVLLDKTGKIKAKVWSNVKKYYALLKPGEIYKFTGTVTEYKGELDARISGIEKAAPEEYNVADFVEKASFDTDALVIEIKEILKNNISNPKVNELIELFFKKYENDLKFHYGAMNIHHAYPGGLLKHTSALIKLAVFIAEQYNLNKDILITGALFHDVGKIFEFSVVPSLKMTIEGGLVGHLVLGNNILIDLASEINDFPKGILLQIQHLILSHHGEKEYGSPEVPKTKEAFAMHIIDLLDSKMAIFSELQDKSDSKELFSDFAHVLGRRILINDKFE